MAYAPRAAAAISAAGVALFMVLAILTGTSGANWASWPLLLYGAGLSAITCAIASLMRQ